MNKYCLYALYVWSAIMFLSGMSSWLSTLGVVRGSEFGLQISILNALAMIMVWLALFGVWFCVHTRSKYE